MNSHICQKKKKNNIYLCTVNALYLACTVFGKNQFSSQCGFELANFRMYTYELYIHSTCSTFIESCFSPNMLYTLPYIKHLLYGGVPVVYRCSKCMVGIGFVFCRKKVMDFYHRSSMAAYCTAFSYRPLTQYISPHLCENFIQVPQYWSSIQEPTSVSL